MKPSKTTARGKFQYETKKLKNQLAEEQKKTKDLIACDKPNSEYEMLLSEKDAIIAEYLSGKDSKYLVTISGIDNIINLMKYRGDKNYQIRHQHSKFTSKFVNGMHGEQHNLLSNIKK